MRTARQLMPVGTQTGSGPRSSGVQPHVTPGSVAASTMVRIILGLYRERKPSNATRTCSTRSTAAVAANNLAWMMAQGMEHRRFLLAAAKAKLPLLPEVSEHWGGSTEEMPPGDRR